MPYVNLLWIRSEAGVWWKRRLEGDYHPIFTVDHAPLVEYLRQIGTIGTMDIPATNQPFQHALHSLRTYVSALDPAMFLWCLCITACVIMWTKRSKRPVSSYRHRSFKHKGKDGRA